MNTIDTLSIANWDNLIELYSDVSDHNTDIFFSKEPIVSYFSQKYGWPNFSLLAALKLDLNKQFSFINEAIEKNYIAPLILVHPELQNEMSITNNFENYGIRQIGQWPLIYYDLKNILPDYEMPKDFNIFYVDTDEKLSHWHDVASEVLFNNKPIPLRYEDRGKHALFVAYEKDTPVASVSAFFGSTSSSAHMVAVLPEYRKKGYGKLIMRAALNLSAEKGYRLCFSQSSKMGLKSWLTLGYQVSGYVNIFWKIGFQQ